MEISALPINIREIRAQGPGRRQLEIHLNITNPTSLEICILDAWVWINSASGLKLGEGKLFYSMHNRQDPATIPANKSGLGAFIIDLPAPVLSRLEEERTGGDIKLHLYSRVLVSEVCIINEVKMLGVPFETQFGRDGSYENLIPQSEWIKLLKSLHWSELEILELPSSSFRVNTRLAQGLKRFEDAQRCYRSGEWEETLVNCRKVVEAVVKGVSEEDDMSKSLEALKSLIGEEKKADRLNELILAFSKFLQLGRHENIPPVRITRSDAQLALHLTGAILVFLGEQ